MYFFFVETRGPTLEEVAKIFDGDEAEVAHVDIHIIEDKQAAMEVEHVETEPGKAV